MANSEEAVVGAATWLYFAQRYLMVTSRPSVIASNEFAVNLECGVMSYFDLFAPLFYRGLSQTLPSAAARQI